MITPTSRRRFLRLAALASGGGLLAACTPAAPTSPTAPPAKPTEAPKPAPAPTNPPTAVPAATKPAATAAAVAPTPVPASGSGVDASLASVWQGKTLTLTVDSAPGSAGDGWVRLIGRNIGRHLPGTPNVVVFNLPGGGGVAGTNSIYEAKPDGLTMGLAEVPEPGPLPPGARYDLAKLNFIGCPTPSASILVVHKRAGVTTVKDLETRETRISGITVGDSSSRVVAILKDLFGWKLKVIYGYSGSADRILAIDRGDVDGSQSSWDSWRTKRPEMEEGTLVPLVQVGEGFKDHPLLAKVASAEQLAASKSQEDRQLLNLVIAPQLWTRIIMAPPGLQPNVLATMQGAFMATMADPQFLAEAQQLGLAVQPMTGEQLRERIGEYHRTPPAILARMERLVEAEEHA